MANFRLIGWIGISNLSLLLMITITKTVRFIRLQPSLNSAVVRKRLLLHILLILAIAIDIPMYISFTMINTYGMITYSFHKLEPAFAYSMTISDWSSVLYDIQEIKHLPLVFRKGCLVFINTIFATVSIMNFVYVNVSTDLDEFTKSPMYIAMIVLQIAAELFLTTMMLSAGIRLSRRIRGVSGMLNATANTSASSLSVNLLTGRMNGSSSSNSVRTRHSTQAYMGFETALNRLITVMATCALCICIQLVLLLLNYVLGYQRQPDKSVGPELFYWTFYAWVPLWGPTLALLYLSRSRVYKDDSIPRDTEWSGSGSKYTSLPINPENIPGVDHERNVDGRAFRTPENERGVMNRYRSDDTRSTAYTASISPGNGRYKYISGSSEASPAPRVNIYRPPDYPSSLFPRETDDDEMEHEDDEVSERTTSSSVVKSAISPCQSYGRTTGDVSCEIDADDDKKDSNSPEDDVEDSYQSDDVLKDLRDHWTPDSEGGSSVDDYNALPPQPFHAANVSFSASHNLFRVSSVGTTGSFSDSIMLAREEESQQKSSNSERK